MVSISPKPFNGMHFVRVQCAMHTRWWCCKITHKTYPTVGSKIPKKIPWESLLRSLSFCIPRQQTDCYMIIFISVPLNRMHKIVARHLIFVNSFFPSFSRKKKLYFHHLRGVIVVCLAYSLTHVYVYLYIRPYDVFPPFIFV